MSDLFAVIEHPVARNWSDGIIVDNFAGGGGASTGIEEATGRDIDVAINHDEEAVAMHTANHPRTRHHCQSIWSVDPLDAVTIDGVIRPVWLAWFSPDCTHHSNARGGKPREKGIRDLAWVVTHWIERLGPARKPAIIKVENVEEFLTWGPLDDEGKRIPERNGETFRLWVATMRKHGYKVEWRVIRACDVGTPTIRKRLCLIARCDGKPIVWPEKSHGPGQARPFRTAAECIDWSIPCPSIFLTREEGRALGVKRPLAEATMARIARGVQRYVIDAAQPFIVNLTHHGSDRVEPLDEPFKTVTGAHRGEKALVVPIVTHAQQGGRNRSVEEPMHTICASEKDQNQIIAAHITKFHTGSTGHAVDEPLHTVTSNSFIKRPGGNVPMAIVSAHLMTMRNSGKPFNGADEPTHTITAGGAHLNVVAATLVQTGYGEREGQAPRALDIEAPRGTVVAGGGKHAMVSAFLSKFATGNDATSPLEPTQTIEAHAKHAVVAAHLAQFNTNPDGSHNAGHPVEEPLSTVSTKGPHQALVATHMISLKGTERRASAADEPAPAVTAGGLHVGEVRAFLLKYYGGESSDEGHAVDAPLGTVTTKDRFGIVMVHGEPYQIVDIGMRMLTPRELFAAQGFPADYIIDPVGPSGKPLTKTAQIRMCGNSVCPPLAAALVRANCGEPDTAQVAA
jgi:DNA (cytosine-5)-methyltransferase 1